MFDNFLQSSREKSDGKVLKDAFLWGKALDDLNYGENGDLTWFKQEQGQNHHEILYGIIAKWSFVPSLVVKTPKISRRKLFRQLCAWNIGKISKVKIKL